MTMRTLTRLYDNHADAVATVKRLEDCGFRDDDISIVSNNRSGTYSSDGMTKETNAGTGAATGATVGGVVGGGAGLLAGLGMLAIPGVGPVVAAGWLVATLAGVGVGAVVGGGAGGLVGSLTGSGVPEDDAHVYAEAVRRGGSLVTARVDEARVGEAERILNSQTFVDPALRRADYQRAGWTRFDENAPAYEPAPVVDPDNRPRL
jgi:hypothetical protein